MHKLTKSVVPIIESAYDTFTNSERIIADFFIENNNKKEDFSAVNISKKLHVSEASLTRFSKKCGYSGYREFIYSYRPNIRASKPSTEQLSKRILTDYDELLNKTYSLFKEEQLEKVIEAINEAKNIYFYGTGSSAFVAIEMKARFMEVGISSEAIIDPAMMELNQSFFDEDTLVIALPMVNELSHQIKILNQVQHQQAKIISFTSNKSRDLIAVSHEVVPIATSTNLQFGSELSTQLPLLLMMDILFGYYKEASSQKEVENMETTAPILNKAVD